jgi:hypothetical protein
VGVEGDAGVHPVRELERGKPRHQELGRVTHGERPGELLDLVVEVDAGGAPHHDLVGLVALEELDGAAAHAGAGGGVPVLMVDNATAVGRAADRDVVELEAIEDRRDRPDHVRGPQDVAAQVQDDLVTLRGPPRRRQPPRALVRESGEILRQRDLAEMPAVVSRPSV